MPIPRRRLAAALLLAAAAAPLPGCLLLAGAALGAGIVHVTSEDGAVVLLEVGPEAAFAAARGVLSDRGVLESADREAGLLRGTVGSSSVEVRVEDRGDGKSRVAVEARKNGGVSPDVTTAQQTAAGILERCR